MRSPTQALWIRRLNPFIQMNQTCCIACIVACRSGIELPYDNSRAHSHVRANPVALKSIHVGYTIHNEGTPIGIASKPCKILIKQKMVQVWIQWHLNRNKGTGEHSLILDSLSYVSLKIDLKEIRLRICGNCHKQCILNQKFTLVAKLDQVRDKDGQVKFRNTSGRTPLEESKKKRNDLD